MKNIVYLIIGVILLAIIGVGIYWYSNTALVHINKGSISTVISTIQRTKQIDKLYTGVYLIPVVNIQRGKLKRDIFTNSPGYKMTTDEEAKSVVKSCCVKQFEVAVGYDNLLNIIGNEEVLSAVCSGNKEKLPKPQILAVNCIHTDVEGDYTDGECFKWEYDDDLRKHVIHQQMEDDKIWEGVENHARDSLKNFMSILCN